MFGNQNAKPSLFGTNANSSSNPFGASTSTSLPTQQPQNSLFGSSLPNQPQNKPTLSLFGSTGQQNQGGSAFGSTLQPSAPTTSLFGASTLQNQQQTNTPFASHNSLGSSLFGSTVQPLPRLGSSSTWQPNASAGPREKSVLDQMSNLSEKWRPDSSNSMFEYYFYNSVPPEVLPYCVPQPGEDEKKWEEALSKKPDEGSIPYLGKSFLAIGNRLEVQVHAVKALQSRLHEINDSLAAMIQKHDLEISVRCQEAKRRHLALGQRCLTLATKAQVMRNRGYALEGSEEELKKRLETLGQQAFDAVLSSRQEEIWARMSGIRARVNVIQAETEKLGNAGGKEDALLDEDSSKKVQRILSDYDSQLNHLLKELAQIRTDFEAWETDGK